MTALRQRKAASLGDALLTTASVAYFPTLDPCTWSNSVRVWQRVLDSRGIAVSPHFSLGAMALSAEEVGARRLPCGIDATGWSLGVVGRCVCVLGGCAQGHGCRAASRWRRRG